MPIKSTRGLIFLIAISTFALGCGVASRLSTRCSDDGDCPSGLCQSGRCVSLKPVGSDTDVPNGPALKNEPAVGLPAGASCETSASCASGLCAATGRGGVCAPTCADGSECPAGWHCASMMLGADPIRVCQPDEPTGPGADSTDASTGDEGSLDQVVAIDAELQESQLPDATVATQTTDQSAPDVAVVTAEIQTPSVDLCAEVSCQPTDLQCGAGTCDAETGRCVFPSEGKSCAQLAADPCAITACVAGSCRQVGTITAASKGRDGCCPPSLVDRHEDPDCFHMKQDLGAPITAPIAMTELGIYQTNTIYAVTGNRLHAVTANGEKTGAFVTTFDTGALGMAVLPPEYLPQNAGLFLRSLFLSHVDAAGFARVERVVWWPTSGLFGEPFVGKTLGPATSVLGPAISHIAQSPNSYVLYLAVNAPDGTAWVHRLNWYFATQFTLAIPAARITQSPVFGYGKVYLVTDGGALHAVSSDGKTSWVAEIGGSIAGPPAIASAGRILVATSQGDLVALDAATGSEVWRVSVGETVATSPLVDTSSRIYLATEQGALHKLSPDGQIVWTATLPGPVLSSPLITLGAGLPGMRLLLPCEGHGIVAVEMGSGSIAWRWLGFAAADKTFASLNISGRLLQVATRSGRIYTLVTHSAANGIDKQWIRAHGDQRNSGNYQRHTSLELVVP